MDRPGALTNPLQGSTPGVSGSGEEQFRALFDQTFDALLLFDDEHRCTAANAAASELLGLPREGLVGAQAGEFCTLLPEGGPDCGALWEAMRRDGCCAGECLVERADGGRRHAQYRAQSAFLLGRHLWQLRDTTEQRRAHGELQAAQEALESRVRVRTTALAHANERIQSRAQCQEAVANFGQRALTGESIGALMQEAAELVCRTLGTDACAALEWMRKSNGEPPLQDSFWPRAAAGWPGDWRKRPIIAHGAAETLQGLALRGREPVVVADASQEQRFPVPAAWLEAGAGSGAAVIIGGRTRPFGVLETFFSRPREFTADDVHFLQSVANVLAEAIERKRAEEAVRQAQQEAERANAAKSEFLSRMSHELRTPLNAILGFGQLLEVGAAGSAHRESTEQIIRAGKHLLEMVNEVLDIARIESGNLALSPEPVDVGLVMREALDLIRPLADARRVKLVLEEDPACEGDYALADRQRLRQSLLNLLSNAVKYNRQGGRVTLTRRPPAPAVFEDHKRLRLEVADTGQGIAADKLPRLFTPFERLGADQSGIEGVGIGLALSKRLVEAQGGEMGVASTEGVGSTFWIDLPMTDEPLAESLPSDLLEGILGDSSPVPATAAAAGPAAVERPTPRTVLYIEDNESNRLLIELLLVQRPGVQLLSASRGWEGVEIACAHRPDLILLDMHLPDMPGEEVLSRLRADERTIQTPLVVISADASSARIRNMRALGAADYLTKPFNVGQFLCVLDTYLAAAPATARTD